MKKLEISFFGEVALVTMIMIVLFMTLFSFKPAAPLPQSSSKITTVTTGVQAYRLNVDGSQYIVVISSGGGLAIIDHR